MMSEEHQEKAHKWIDTGWKAGSIIWFAISFWAYSTFATKDSLLTEHNARVKEQQDEHDSRIKDHYEMLLKIDRWAEQDKINLSHDSEIKELDNRVRTLEKATVWSGKMLDNRDLGHP